MGHVHGRRTSGPRWLPAVAGASALCALLLALSTNVASSLVPEEWAKRHAVWVWAAVVALGLVSVWLGILTARGGAPEPAVSAGRDANVDTSTVHVGDTSGPVVIAGPGAQVTFQSLEAEPAPAQREGQLVIGELPGAPPAFVARAAVARLAEVFAAGGRVAAVSALVDARGAGKTQVAAAYARQAVADGVELVAWVSADDHDRLVSGLAEVARRIGACELDADSETAAQCLREALATRTSPAVLVIDNAVDAGDVRAFLPATGAVRVIVTSNHRAFAALGTEIRVGVFDRAQSVAYLRRRTGLDDEPGADAVADELGDLPLALAQAATVIDLRGLSYEAYLERLSSAPLTATLPADRGDAYPHGVARAIAMSIDAVQDADATGLTRRVLEACSLLADDGVSRGVLREVVAGGERDDLDAALERLVEISLLVWARDRDAVVMHRLVARSIRDRLDEDATLAAALAAAAEGLQRLAIPEQEAWQRRAEGVELVGHAIDLWARTVAAADSGSPAEEDAVAVARLARWAVRHLRATADLSRAIELGTSALTGCERILGPDHPDTLTSRNDLAGAYETAGDLTRAIPLFERALTDRERILGPDHPDTLTSRNNLAGAYETAGDLTRAIPLYERTLADRKRTLGPDHPDTLTSRNNLAVAYDTAGDLTRAIPLHERTLTDRERALGPDHPDTLSSRNNLAAAYDTAGDLTRAIPLHERTLADCERTLGPDHPNTLSSRNNLAGAYKTAGDLARATTLLERTLADRERILGPDHPDTLTSRNNLAYTYQAAGDLDRAVPLFERTLADCERILGPDHPLTVTVRANTLAARAAQKPR